MKGFTQGACECIECYTATGKWSDSAKFPDMYADDEYSEPTEHRMSVRQGSIETYRKSVLLGFSLHIYRYIYIYRQYIEIYIYI